MRLRMDGGTAVDGARLGIHLLVWGAGWGDPAFDLPRVLATCRALGFGGVEVPWLEPVPASAVAAAAAAVRAAGLWATVSTALPPEACLVDPLPERRARGVQWLRAAAEAAAAFGSPVLVGPLLAPVGELPAGAARSAAPAGPLLAEVAAHAAGLGVRLCLEPLNRFETDVVNTLAQGAALCAAAGDGPRLLSDTFHQNIEEDDPLEALRRHLGVVGHVHLSENHRGPAGSGHIPFPAVLGVLEDGGYGGRLVFEGFNAHVRALARATCIWRPAAPSPEAFAARTAETLLGTARGAG